jgi:hypothetical protein
MRVARGQARRRVWMQLWFTTGPYLPFCKIKNPVYRWYAPLSRHP